jgi:hypothetical protein
MKAQSIFVIMLVLNVVCLLWVHRLDRAFNAERKRIADSIRFAVSRLHDFLRLKPQQFEPEAASVLAQVFDHYGFSTDVLVMEAAPASTPEPEPEEVPKFGSHPLRAWFLGAADRKHGHPYRLEASVLDYFGLKASDMKQEDRIILRTRYHEGFHGTCDRSRDEVQQ